MVGHHALWLWFLLIALVLGSLCAFLAYLSRLAGIPTFRVRRFLRAADADQVFFIMGSKNMPHFSFSQRKSVRSQRTDLQEIREFMLLMFHNMRVLIAWSASQLRMFLVDKPWEKEGETLEDIPKFVAAQLKVLRAARKFRWYAFLAIIRITFWLVFRTHWWLPVRSPRLSRLEKICRLEFRPLFRNLINALSDLTVLADPGSEDLKNHFLTALIRHYVPEDPLKNVPLTGRIM